MKKHTEITPTGKKAEHTVHEDGRKSVTVHVDTIKVNPEADEGEKGAAKIINEQILPMLNERVVLVTVIHKDSLLKATVKTKFVKVRQVVETLIAGFPINNFKSGNVALEDFIVVEVEGDDVRVTKM